MDWPTIINEILWMEEITQKQLSASLTTFNTPAAINALKQGRTVKPRSDLGSELIKRHKQLKRKQAEQRRIEDDIARYRQEHVQRNY